MNIKKPIDLENKALQFLTGLLGLFFLSKMMQLNTPLFHDELGVYGRALFYMIDHGSSMIPGDIDPEISRGHPLFFAFFVSQISSWFGGSYFVARLTVLFLAMGLLVATYWLGKELVNKKTGLLAAASLSFQPIFFSQSTLILPEIMLSLLGLLSLLFYVRKQYFWYFAFASLLVLTKETALVILGGIVLNEWYKNKFRIDFFLIKTNLIWLSPLVCFFLFLWIQKQQHGWYLYPYHTSFISFSISSICLRMTMALVLLFLNQGRFILTIIALVALARMGRTARKKLLNQNFLFLAVAINMLGFSSINYLMARYFLLILPLLILSFMSILQKQNYRLRHLLFYFVCTIPFQSNFWVFCNDDNMSYLVVVSSMQKSIAELDRITAGKKAKIFAEFPEINALEDPRNGYTNNPNYILTDKYDETVDYILRSSNKHSTNNQSSLEIINGHIQPIDTIINKLQAYPNTKIKLVYEAELYYNKQRIFKTNN